MLNYRIKMILSLEDLVDYHCGTLRDSISFTSSNGCKVFPVRDLDL